MIRLEKVGLRYGAGEDEASPDTLTDVSLHIKPNSFQFLTGNSGAGKTSLMRLIFLSLKPTRGKIFVFGQDSSLMTKTDLSAIRRRIGIVFQDFRLLDHLSTYENVALPLRVQGKDESTYRHEVVELLDWVGLGAHIHAYPPSLSGGEKQRAAIARALIFRPELLLADEPTGNVDPALAQRILRLFVELNRSGTSIMIATHDYSLLNQVNATRLILDKGRLTQYD